MREIKFRAWHKEAKTMLQVGDKFGTTHPLDCCNFARQGQPLILMQFTGLLDKSGREIYEGDILLGDGEENDQVVYRENKFLLEPLGDDCVYWHRCEVIGNIYENPDLLTTKGDN